MVHAGPARPRKWRSTDVFRSKSVDLEWIWVLPLGAGRLERPNGHLEKQRPARASVAMLRLVSPLTRNAGTKVCAKSFTKGLSSDDSRCSPGRPQAAAAREAFLYMHGQTRRRHRAVACLRCPGTASRFAMPRTSTPAPSKRRQRACPRPAPPRAAGAQQGNAPVGGSMHSAQGQHQPKPSLQQRNTRNPDSGRRLYIQRSRLHRQHTCKVSAMLLSCSAEQQPREAR